MLGRRAQLDQLSSVVIDVRGPRPMNGNFQPPLLRTRGLQAAGKKKIFLCWQRSPVMPEDDEAGGPEGLRVDHLLSAWPGRNPNRIADRHAVFLKSVRLLTPAKPKRFEQTPPPARPRAPATAFVVGKACRVQGRSPSAPNPTLGRRNSPAQDLERRAGGRSGSSKPGRQRRFPRRPGLRVDGPPDRSRIDSCSGISANGAVFRASDFVDGRPCRQLACFRTFKPLPRR